MRFCHGIEIEDDVKNGGGRKEGKFGLSSGIFDWSEYVNLVFFFSLPEIKSREDFMFSCAFANKTQGGL